MSATDSTECDHLKLAAAKMVAHPMLSVKDAMILAKLTKTYNKRSLSGHDEVGSLVKSINVEKGKNSDVSPLTSNSMASLLGSNGSQKPKS